MRNWIIGKKGMRGAPSRRRPAAVGLIGTILLCGMLLLGIFCGRGWDGPGGGAVGPVFPAAAPGAVAGEASLRPPDLAGLHESYLTALKALPLVAMVTETGEGSFVIQVTGEWELLTPDEKEYFTDSVYGQLNAWTRLVYARPAAVEIRGPAADAAKGGAPEADRRRSFFMERILDIFAVSG